MSYIDNVVDALLLIEEKDIAIGETYWIADRCLYPTIEIYRTIAKLLEVKELKPKFIPAFVCTMCAVCDSIIQSTGFYIKEIHVAGEMAEDITCSVKKARKELGYEPKIGLEEGMKKSVEWCMRNGITI